ncbi:cation diffusion facilitator family transporter [Arcobacter sp. s6]|uniref:cation diffusion facilitator family transporter n=1 Tax=Arcobacter sp. s6 TaxID=3230363 RepID=UPI0034A0036C
MSEHEHHHNHSHSHNVSGKNLFITIVLNIIITLSQIIGGIMSGSLALLSDALHNFSDVLALVLTYWTNKIAKKDKNNYKTFGYKRAEILATLFNSTTLIIIAIYLIIESINKFFNPQSIDSILVIGLGILSIILNAISVLLVKDDAHNNMNVKAAYLHLVTDVMTSVAVVIGGVLMYYYNIFWIDPVISLLIAFYLIKASYFLLIESVNILMQGAPSNIDIKDIKKNVETFDEVLNIHHLHIWRLDDHDIHLEAHVDFKENLLLEEVNQITSKIEKYLKSKYHISHITLQAEYDCCENKNLLH